MKLISDFTSTLEVLNQTKVEQTRQGIKHAIRKYRHDNSITLVDDKAFKELKEQLKNGELLLPDDSIQRVVRSTAS